MAVTAGNVSDVTVAAELLHEQEEELYGDAGYQGLENRAAIGLLTSQYSIKRKN